MSEEASAKNILKILGIALALPSTILGVAFGVYYLISEKIISQEVGLLVIVLIVAYFFYLMVRYARLNK